MTCPHCSHSFPLTWRRYAKSPLGKHTCPACGRASRFKLTASYLASVLVAWVVFLSLALGIIREFYDIPVSWLALVLVATLLFPVPSIIAQWRRVRASQSISALNGLLIFTFVCGVFLDNAGLWLATAALWVLTLAWAIAGGKRDA